MNISIHFENIIFAYRCCQAINISFKMLWIDDFALKLDEIHNFTNGFHLGELTAYESLDTSIVTPEMHDGRPLL